jgi:phosphatidylglycerol:prolipoprotein diacylglycerol transferase
MLPVLIDLGFIKIYTFGIFLVLAFLWTAYFVWKNIQLTSFKEEQVFDGLFLSLGGGLLVSRFVYILFHFEDFGFDVLKYILINGYPGLSFWGGVIGFFLTMYIFTSVQKLRFMELIDYIIPPVFLALAIGKIGSFFSGVEVGSETGFFLAIKYANYDGMRHLTAFYEGLIMFLGSFLSYQLLFQIRKTTLSKGFLFWFFLWFLSGVYAAIDLMRIGQVYIFGQNVYLIVSLAIFIILSIYFIYYLREFYLSKLFPKG